MVTKKKGRYFDGDPFISEILLVKLEACGGLVT